MKSEPVCRTSVITWIVSCACACAAMLGVRTFRAVLVILQREGGDEDRVVAGRQLAEDAVVGDHVVVGVVLAEEGEGEAPPVALGLGSGLEVGGCLHFKVGVLHEVDDVVLREVEVARLRVDVVHAVERRRQRGTLAHKGLAVVHLEAHAQRELEQSAFAIHPVCVRARVAK